MHYVGAITLEYKKNKELYSTDTEKVEQCWNENKNKSKLTELK